MGMYSWSWIQGCATSKDMVPLYGGGLKLGVMGCGWGCKYAPKAEHICEWVQVTVCEVCLKVVKVMCLARVVKMWWVNCESWRLVWVVVGVVRRGLLGVGAKNSFGPSWATAVGAGFMMERPFQGGGGDKPCERA